MASLTNQGLFYTEQLGAGLRVAQVLGLTSTAFFAGKSFSQSFSTVPALLQAPAPLLAKQWKTMFDSDKLLGPAVVLLSAPVFGYLAYRDPNRFSSTPSILYTVATSLTLLTVPYTLLLGEPINQQLEKKASSLASASLTDSAAEAGVAKEETTHVLVDRWATINLGRTILTAVASFSAAWAALEGLSVVPAPSSSFGLSNGAGRMGN